MVTESVPPPRNAAGSQGIPEDAGAYRWRVDGVTDLLQIFGRMRVRPTRRQGDIPVPVLSITGPPKAISAAATAIDGLCGGGPFARLTPVIPGDGSPPYLRTCRQLRHAADGLAAAAPRLEPRLRFPLLNQALWLVDRERDEDLSQNEPDRLHKHVRAMLRRRSFRSRTEQRTFWTNVRAYAEGPLPTWAAAGALVSSYWAERAGMVFALTAIALSVLLGVLQVFWLSRDWAGRYRYRWFRHQPYLWPRRRERGHSGLAAFAEQVYAPDVQPTKS